MNKKIIKQIYKEIKKLEISDLEDSFFLDFSSKLNITFSSQINLKVKLKGCN
jgi:hypothetical protein